MPGVVARENLEFPWETPPATGELREVAPGILWARFPLPFRLDHVNIYFIEDGDGWAVFDTGISNDATRAVWEQMFANGLAGKKITRLIASHHHPDHMGLAGWLCEKLDIPLWTSQTAYLTCENMSLNPGAAEAQIYYDFYTHHGLADATAQLVRSEGHNYLHMVSGLPLTFRRMVMGDTLKIGGRKFHVFSGDGHAPEQIMLYCPEAKVLLSADQVIARITPNVSVWAVDPEGNPLGLYLRSLKMLPANIPDDVLVLPGHQMPFYGLHLRCAQLIAHHEERCGLIDAACRKAPQSVAELVPVLFTRALDPHQLSFAFNEVFAHVNHMIVEEQLRTVISEDGFSRVVAI